MKIYPSIHEESLTDRLFQIAATYIHSSIENHPFQIVASPSSTRDDLFHRVPFIHSSSFASPTADSEPETIQILPPVPPIQVEHLLTNAFSYQPDLAALFSCSENAFNYLAPRYPDFQKACFLYYTFENVHPLKHVSLNTFVTNVVRRLRASHHENFTLYVYSDDFQRCKRQAVLQNAHVQYVEQPEHLALNLMTMCKFGVCVTNELSWWGAYIHSIPRLKTFIPDTLANYSLPHLNCVNISTQKYELLDITFIFPLRVTNQVDLENANIQLAYLGRHFFTHIIVYEWGTKSHREQLDFSHWNENEENQGTFYYEFLNSEKSILPRKQIVQMCQYIRVKSEHIALIDWRTLLPVSSYLESQRLLSSHDCDVVLPYRAANGLFPIHTFEMRDRLDLDYIPSIIPICISQYGEGYTPEYASSQWATIWRKGAYYWSIKDDGCLFQGDPFEYDDLLLQAKYYGLRIRRVENYVFVLPCPFSKFSIKPAIIANEEYKRKLLEKYGVFHVHRLVEETMLMHRHNQKNRPRVYFLSFGGGFIVYYKEAMTRITQQARDLCVFDRVYGFHTDSLKVDPVFWRKQCGFIGKNTQGWGLWIWKPYLIRKILYNMEPRDILMYSDAGNELDLRKRDAILSLFDAVQSEKILGNVVSRKERQCTEIQCTKRDVWEHYFGLQLNDPLLNTPQRETNCLIIQKDPATMALVEEWTMLATENHHYLDNSPSFLPNYMEFQEHRHDRSLFSLLTKKHNLFGQTPIGEAVDVMRNNSKISCLKK